MKYIFEVPVYCGALKHWRVLNLSSGTVYSGNHETLEEAIASIEDGKERAGCIVRGVSVPQIAGSLEWLYEHPPSLSQGGAFYDNWGGGILTKSNAKNLCQKTNKKHLPQSH